MSPVTDTAFLDFIIMRNYNQIVNCCIHIDSLTTVF